MDAFEKQQQHIAFVFSIIFPGAGFLFMKKWVKGIIYGLIHTFLMVLALINLIKIISSGVGLDSIYGTIFLLVVFVMLINWIFNIRSTQDYK